RNGLVAAFFARVEEIPDAIFPDRTADAAGIIPELHEVARLAQSAVDEILRVIAADHAAAHAREVQIALDRVAAGLRHDVHHRSADSRFPESARRRARDLLRAAQAA